jgi:hypothetical protein
MSQNEKCFVIKYDKEDCGHQVTFGHMYEILDQIRGVTISPMHNPEILTPTIYRLGSEAGKGIKGATKLLKELSG